MFVQIGIKGRTKRKIFLIVRVTVLALPLSESSPLKPFSNRIILTHMEISFQVKSPVYRTGFSSAILIKLTRSVGIQNSIIFFLVKGHFKKIGRPQPS